MNLWARSSRTHPLTQRVLQIGNALQYSGHVRRNAAKMDQEELKKSLLEMFVTLSMDSYRMDYRETLLRLKSALDASLGRLPLNELSEVWKKSKYLCPDEAAQRTESQLDFWYPGVLD